MFWTAFIWGLGVSSGACGGLLAFFVLKTWLDRLMNTKSVAAIVDFNERSLEALLARNEISERMAASLLAIASRGNQLDPDWDIDEELRKATEGANDDS